MRTAYYLFRLHNVMPSKYYHMDFGEKQIVRAFTSYEIDEINALSDVNGESAGWQR